MAVLNRQTGQWIDTAIQQPADRWKAGTASIRTNGTWPGTAPLPPPAPSCLVASAGASNSIVLSWNDVAWPAGSTGRVYEVHEDLFLGSDRVVATVTTPTRTSGTANGTYRYYVLAKCSTGTSVASPKITVKAPVAATVRSPAGCTIARS